MSNSDQDSNEASVYHNKLHLVFFYRKVLFDGVGNAIINAIDFSELSADGRNGGDKVFRHLSTFEQMQGFCMSVSGTASSSIAGTNISQDVQVFYRLQGQSGPDRLKCIGLEDWFEKKTKFLLEVSKQVHALLTEKSVYYSELEKSGDLVKLANQIAKDVEIDILVFGAGRTIFPESDPFDFVK
jgi:hypothetical protein